jgi:predicted GIY-YIG superfamily endonuclease
MLGEGCPAGALAEADLSTMQHVYVLQSLKESDRYYTGCTNDVAARLRRHNSGKLDYQSHHTAMYGPWKLIVQVSFEDRTKAFAFERYLQSGSGRASAKK